MDLLDKIKGEDILHPLADKSSEIKIAFAKMVVYAIYADDSLAQRHKERYTLLLKQLHLSESEQEELMHFFQEPVSSEFKIDLKTIESYQDIYLLEIATLFSKEQISSSIEEYGAYVMQSMQREAKEFNLLLEYLIQIKEKSAKSGAVALIELIQEHKKNGLLLALLSFYKTDIALKSELKELIAQKSSELFQERMRVLKERSKISWSFPKKMMQNTKQLLKASEKRAIELQRRQEQLEKESNEFEEQSRKIEQKMDEEELFWDMLGDMVA